MKVWTMVAAAAFALPTAAYACSCVASDDPVELKRYAGDAATNAIALVEAETLTVYQQGGPGETMRVVRTLAGNAPTDFRIERGRFPSSASCDILYEKGQKALIILFPPEKPASGVYRTSGLCTGMMLDKPAFRDELVRILASKSTPERG